MHVDGLNMKQNDQPKNHLQLIWAVVLMSVGVAVFLEIPRKMSQLVQLWQSPAKIWAFKICFYLVGILLVGGGIRKMIQYFQPNGQHRPEGTDNHESDR
jgi:uncharacterized membrane protein HdeD (DUF308 family)